MLRIELPFCYNLSDLAIVDSVRNDIISFVDVLQNPILISNPPSLEQSGLQWILSLVNKGDLRFQKLIRSLRVIDSHAICDVEVAKLCNGAFLSDPITAASDSLLGSWDFEDKKIINM